MTLNASNYQVAIPPETQDLIDRLRGIYRIPITDGLGAVGAGEEPDNPEHFVRRFETPPIQHQAAAVIEVLLAKIYNLIHEEDDDGKVG